MWMSVAAGAAALLGYLALVPAVSGGGDSSEFTVVLATFGLAHPTGYPWYTALGHVFVVAAHACGAAWPWAANAWSGVGAAVAVAVLHALAARLPDPRHMAPRTAAVVALLPAAAFAIHPLWVDAATLAEITSWHVAWALGACLFACTVRRRGTDAERDPLTARALAWGAIVGGGATHHATSLLASVPLTIGLVLALRPSWREASACVAGAMLVVAAGWGYVLFRSFHPAAAQWDSLLPGLHGMWNHVTAAGYRHYLGSFAPSPEDRHAILVNVVPWLVPGVAAVLAQTGAAPRRARVVRWALVAAVLTQAAYPLFYGVPDPAGYFLPSVAVGLAAVPAALASIAGVRRVARPLAWAAALAIAIATWPRIAAAREHRASLVGLDAFLRRMWGAVPIARGFVVFDDDMSYRLVQYQQLDHDKPALLVVRPRLLMDDGARALFARRHGIDPLGGGEPARDADASPERITQFAVTVADGINRASPDTVIVFLPEVPSLRMLVKERPVRSGR